MELVRWVTCDGRDDDGMPQIFFLYVATYNGLLLGCDTFVYESKKIFIKQKNIIFNSRMDRKASLLSIQYP